MSRAVSCGSETQESGLLIKSFACIEVTMASRACACSATSFGPASCSGHFDFTLLFEQAILGIAPACLFLLATLWRFHHTWKASIKTTSSHRYILKLVSSSVPPNTISPVLTDITVRYSSLDSFATHAAHPLECAYMRTYRHINSSSCPGPHHCNVSHPSVARRTY